MSGNPVDLPSLIRPYQGEGIQFLVDNHSALLADDMGLGKTVQVIVACELLYRSNKISRILIVCPTSLKANWIREFQSWAPNLAVQQVAGTGGQRSVAYKFPIPVLIASYDQIRLDAKQMDPNIIYDLVVLDEAQWIKNPNSRVAQSCRSIRRERSWALTGTPLENTINDLISILRFTIPGKFHEALSREELQDRMRPHFLRRTKKNVLSELPGIIVQDMPLELTPQQSNSYTIELENARGNNLNRVPQADLFALITRLKQICNRDPETSESSKLELLKLLVENMSSDNGKMLVFSQYVQTLEWLSREIETVPSDLFHGGLSSEERNSVLKTFQSTPGPRILLTSIRAGGVGLNLNEADYVVLFDRWWNPAVEEQAINRAHRLGRTQTLHVYKFLVTDTIEMRIQELLLEKHAIFSNMFDRDEEFDPGKLTREQLIRILSQDQTQ